MTADLHLHTTSSDGWESGARRVEQAAAVGLGAIAITDHNAISAIPGARQVAGHWGVEVIAGVELDCTLADLHTHIVGLFVDLDSPAFQADMLMVHESWRGWTREVMGIVGPAAGVDLQWRDLRFWGDVPTGGDVTQALRRKGYTGPIGLYGPPGCPDRVLPPLSATEVCDLIHRAGGVAVLAHPWKHVGLGEWTEPAQFAHIPAAGLDAWECWRHGHTEEQTGWLLSWAERLKLLPSGGSDYHGPKPEETTSHFGRVWVEEPAVEALRAKAAEYR